MMIKDLLDDNETIIWEAQPDRLTYVVGSPVFYLFALVWGAFDFGFISLLLGSGAEGPGRMGFFLIPFFLLHLMLVWIAIGGPIYRAANWHRIRYVITQKRIYIESGMIGRDVQILDLADIRQPEVNVGLIERLRNCGSVRLNPYLETGSKGSRRTAYRGVLAHIANPYDIFKLVKQISAEVRSGKGTTYSDSSISEPAECEGQ